ncbi:MAG: hypothetical protein KY445_10675, partial [Armatimonadetes bacterium]|nr:hypothetical protein [Armatimonadota bacterium]
EPQASQKIWLTLTRKRYQTGKPVSILAYQGRYVEGMSSNFIGAYSGDTYSSHRNLVEEDNQIHGEGFNVPLLFGKEVKEIRRILGESANEVAPDSEIIRGLRQEGRRVWIRNNTILIANGYEPEDKILYFRLNYINPPQNGSKEDLIRLGRLVESDRKYMVENLNQGGHPREAKLAIRQRESARASFVPPAKSNYHMPSSILLTKPVKTSDLPLVPPATPVIKGPDGDDYYVGRRGEFYSYWESRGKLPFVRKQGTR